MNALSPVSVAVPLLAAMIGMPVVADAAASVPPAACSAASGGAVPTVVELYTSEGCDSCPPADRWFSSLKADSAKGRVVPLAFHVDYWDYLGWKDRFGDPAYSARHREAASRGGAKVVYTPQVLVDGREYMQWRKPGDKLPAAATKARAELRVAASLAGPQIKVEVKGAGTQAARGAEAWIALYENGISSDVKAGENRGVLLRHDFVVRKWLGPFAFDGASLAVSRGIELPQDSVPANSGIAVVATDERGSILQAVTLPLRDCAG